MAGLSECRTEVLTIDRGVRGEIDSFGMALEALLGGLSMSLYEGMQGRLWRVHSRPPQSGNVRA